MQERVKLASKAQKTIVLTHFTVPIGIYSYHKLV
jgi:hypothetical protein